MDLNTNKTLLIIIIILCFTLICIFCIDQQKYNKYDLNHDGIVDINDYKEFENYLIEKGLK